MTPAAIKQARHSAGHTQTKAAQSVFVALRTWQDWEAGKRRMPQSAWILYLLLTGQHSDKIIIDR